MKTLFSTEYLHPSDKFKSWREAMSELRVPAELKRITDDPFDGKLEFAKIGSIEAIRTSHSALRAEATPNLVRRHGQENAVGIFLRLAGVAKTGQSDRASVQRPGDLMVLDSSPAAQEYSSGSQMLTLHIPRERLESFLGPAHLYSGLTIGSNLGSTALATGFLTELMKVSPNLTPDAAERMASIGVDLIMASLAERMAQEVPRSIHGNTTVQRAKAYVEANLGDPGLDPRLLAAAVGVSLRRLQELFYERGRHISDYIWGRRLETAAKRLSDPACAHMSIGMLAYGCGFSSQSHFARRFKDRFSISPRDYRQTQRQDVSSVAFAFGLPNSSAE
ncbi:helix-turn-helix domain-containing protein [Methylobacterium brachiatum]|uniref:helix-turn-helix domain-containing protein n=1 Tax=Methylobacterium brachiatum TaxID=269660 RepID=UPI000EFDB1FC|nr:helix-turn-helix domain-containing protein [Methylobacterium brachiatum]AYO81581.1 helix-turn-helix domain-containing protein [Methylobacterium brachiatum]